MSISINRYQLSGVANATQPHHQPEEIEEAQSLLLHLGYSTGSAQKGIFDDRTSRALEFYQREHGLDASGQLDAETMQSLRATFALISTEQKPLRDQLHSAPMLANIHLRRFDATQQVSRVRSGQTQMVDQANAAFRTSIKKLASDKERFHATLKESFGEYDYEKAEALRLRTLRGDFSWLPKVRVVDEHVLQGGLGAYRSDTDEILLSSSLAANDALAEAIFAEEVGHHIDSLIRDKDAAGDEGELFSLLVRGEVVSDARKAELRAENDHGVIQIDGKHVEVEFFVGKALKALGKAASAVGNVVKDAVNEVVDTVVDTVTGVAKAVGGFFRGFIDGVLGAGKAAFRTFIDTTIAATKSMIRRMKRVLSEIANGVYNTTKTAFNIGKDLVQGVGGFLKGVSAFVLEIAQGDVDKALDKLGRGVDSLTQLPGRMANRVSDLLDESTGIFRALLGKKIGGFVERIAKRAIDVQRTATTTLAGINRNLVRSALESVEMTVSGLGKMAEALVSGDFDQVFPEFKKMWTDIGTISAGTAVDLGARAIAGTVSISEVSVGYAPPTRRLTPEESARISAIYGKSIDLTQVRIARGSNMTLGDNGRYSRVVGNTIYLAPSCFDADGKLTDSGMNILLHEAGHVWQNQRDGGRYIHEALIAQQFEDDKAYLWAEYRREGIPFSKLNPEAQAEVMADLAIWIHQYNEQAKKQGLPPITGPEDLDGLIGEQLSHRLNQRSGTRLFAATKENIAYLRDAWTYVLQR